MNEWFYYRVVKKLTNSQCSLTHAYRTEKN